MTKGLKANIQASAYIIDKKHLTSNHIVVDVSKYDIKLEENEVAVVEIEVGN